MARKAARRTRRPTPRPAAAADDSPRARIIEAFMTLLGERPIERIALPDIAERAGVTLAELRGEFSSPLSIFAAHVKQLDREVLSGADAEMEEESPRERLFDVLMRRLELLAPHCEAVRSLMRSARVNPPLALALNAIAVRSQQWMLAAAGIGASGPKGMLRAQGLALLFANVLRTWVDDDEDQTRTLAALDRELGTGQRLSGLLDDLCRIPRAACNLRQRLREAARRGGPRRRERGVRDGDERLAM